MIYVYDASFVIAILLPDESNPKIDSIHDALEESDSVYVPQLIWYETVNIFRNLIWRGRFTMDEVMQFYPILSFPNFHTDFETIKDYSQKILTLCSSHDISAYDAVYLELADRKKAVLCSLNEKLINAAKSHGVEVIQHTSIDVYG